MIRVTRYNANGGVHHTCLTSGPVVVGNNEFGRIFIDMPLRFWVLFKGHTLVIESAGEA
jgi:hypothetical protein